MKYLLTAISILAALCLGLLIAPLLTPRPKPVAGALVVNQRVYLPQELEAQLRATPYHFDSRGEWINDLIYRELLLQEAKRQKIDTESDFRHSMRDFFEQSMIKTLIDRQSAAGELLPNPSQVAACQPLLEKRFQLKKINYAGREQAEGQEAAHGETFDLPFLELPEDIRSILPELNGGELSPPAHSSGGWFRVQLLNIADLPAREIPSPLEQEELCRTELKRQAFQNWLEGLYRQANIELPTALAEGGEQ